jgi:precorrin-6B methylase 2
MQRVLGAGIPLLAAAETASAVGAYLRVQVDGVAVSPALAAALDAVIDALDLRDALAALHPDEVTAVLGIVEGFLVQAGDFVTNPGRAGWDHEQASILMAQGHTSVLIAGVLRRFAVPLLGDEFAARMERDGASFLDVGAGVAALTIGMCRLWPSLRAVGIDPWQPALDLAREHVARTGMQERIELREQRAEDLADEEAYDLAWVPTFFLADDVLEQAVERVHAALKPGGWLLLGMYARPGDPLVAAIADLRTARQGGTSRTPQELETMLSDAGFEDVGARYDEAWRLPVTYIAGRRRL